VNQGKQDTLLEDIRNQVFEKRAIFLVGAGVAAGATKGNPVASWPGLLHSGVERCLSVVPILPTGWAERVRADIDSSDMDDLLSAAEKIQTKLSDQGGEFGRWLQDTVGMLRPEDPSVIQAIARLRRPIVTTNYDSLFEQVTHLPAVTWIQSGQIERVLRGDDQAIIHLHGHWRDSTSVVLGIRSYETVRTDFTIQAILQGIRSSGTLIFVGFGAGLGDPNLKTLRAWARKAFSDSPYRHYRLCLQSELAKVRAEHTPEERIFALPYGNTYSDLPAFLEWLGTHPETLTEVSGANRPEQDETHASPKSNDLLPGVQTAQISISQMFRMADLLISPQSGRARKFYEMVTDANKLRRVFNGGRKFPLGALGAMKPAVSSSERSDNFWRAGLPDLRGPTARPLAFIPFELSLSERLASQRWQPDSAIRQLLDRAGCDIENIQTSGRLRIYPPGVGLVRLNLILKFQKGVHVEFLANLARDIEGMLFVDPNGLEKPCELLLLEVINQASETLFGEGKLPHDQRRWRPPEVTYTLYDDGFNPENSIGTLVQLMSRAPGNDEGYDVLTKRFQQAFESTHWRRGGVLAVAGQGVALLFIAAPTSPGGRRRQKLQGWLIETAELVSAAAYAQKEFLEEVQRLSLPRILDESWLPENGAKFSYLASMLRTMRAVFQAIALARIHLQQQGDSVFIYFARNIWKYDNPVCAEDLDGALSYVQEWAKASVRRREDHRLTDILDCLNEIRALGTPFDQPKPQSISDH
jgi:hypothetical protein